jgi:hypothetical protein
LLFHALNVAGNGIYVVEELTNIAQLVQIYSEAGNWTDASDAAVNYFKHKEKYPDAVVVDDPGEDTEIAQYLARACLEMHGVVEGFRCFETVLREFPQGFQRIGPSNAVFEHACQTKNGAKRQPGAVAGSTRSAMQGTSV